MTCYQINSEDVSWKEMDGQFIIIHLETTNYYALNDSGSIIWAFLMNEDNNPTMDQIISHVSEYFDVVVDTIRDDIRELVSHLLTERLIIKI